MSFEMPNFLPALPEIFLLGMICIILLLDLFISDRNRMVTYLLSQASLVMTLVITLGMLEQPKVTTFSDTFVMDPMGAVLKLFILGASFAVFLYARDYLRARDMFRGEFYVLGLLAVLGMMIMVSAHNFLTIYLGLETMSLALYAMVALQRDSVVASEAAMKYFILGAMASAMLLYGISMIYGVTGSLDLAEVSRSAQTAGEMSTVLIFGLVFLVIGIAFKLGAVPFHMWVPDVYHGAPTAVTLMINTAPKLAAFAMLMRILVDGLAPLAEQWTQMLAILAVLSLVIGNVVAIAQTNIKRMLAYSGISHIGFLMLGIASGIAEGQVAAMFYALVYVIMGLGGFGMVILLSRKGFEAENLADFRGLNHTHPGYALLMLLFMLSMAGVPPMLGFWGKLAVIQALVQADMVGLAITAVVFSVIGAFYYLRVCWYMYFDKPDTTEVVIEASSDMRALLSVNGVAVLLLGLYPGAMLALCESALLP